MLEPNQWEREFDAQLSFLQKRSLQTVDQRFSSITAQRAAAGTFRSGPTLKAFASEASQSIETFAASVVRLVSDFSAKCPTHRLSFFEKSRTAVTEFRLQIAELEGLRNYERAVSMPSAIQRFLEMTKDAEEAAKMMIRQGELGIGFSAQGRTEAAIQNVLNVEQLNGIVQQGANNNISVAQHSLDIEQIAALLSSINELITAQASSNNAVSQVEADIDTINAQLSKSTPNKTILSEAGKSLRAVVEGSLGSALGSELTPLLARLIGLISP